uniref:Uncharacterized protein n=1 Tax=Grammatophora oceanica TaxID=210454 RepID=A0A6U5H3Y5_9STRA
MVLEWKICQGLGKSYSSRSRWHGDVIVFHESSVQSNPQPISLVARMRRGFTRQTLRVCGGGWVLKSSSRPTRTRSNVHRGPGRPKLLGPVATFGKFNTTLPPFMNASYLRSS